MQMRQYRIKMFTNLNVILEQKYDYWVKPGSKFLFLLIRVFFTEGNLDFSFYHSINQKKNVFKE